MLGAMLGSMLGGMGMSGVTKVKTTIVRRKKRTRLHADTELLANMLQAQALIGHSSI